MKKVFWISRHTMTPEQISDLERITNGTVVVNQYKDTVNSVSSLVDDINDSDIIAAVLPVDKMAELISLAGDKPVLRANSKRVATGKMYTNANGDAEEEFQFVHDYWEQMIKIEIVSKKL